MPYYTYVSPEGEEKEVFHLICEINNLSDKTKQEYQIDDTWKKKIESPSLLGFYEGSSGKQADQFKPIK